MFTLSKQVYRTVASLCTAFVLAGLMLAAFTSAQAQAKEPEQASTSKPAPPPTVAPELVAKADQFVKVNNYVASIDSAIKLHLSKQEVAQVANAIKNYNNTNLEYRKNGTRVAVLNNSGTPNDCSWSIGASWHWWGVTVFIGGCILNAITNPSNAKYYASVLARFSWWGVAAAVVLVVYFSWLKVNSDSCGQRGANINVPWLGRAWVSKVC